ncbi:MAG: acyloxyacyl hydrolase [Proteobacteria bacterium]|nr:acyloxyacyl hydrolase [Pseudomonadota bacterium]MBU1716744.1 acyloxyacyl hydrolase [Pseudomonadota bacterium]
MENCLFLSGKVLLLLILIPGSVLAGEGGFNDPERAGIGVTFGHSYDPSPTFGFLQITGILQYDYDRIWPHPAPEPLYFKVEASLGLADYHDNKRLMTSANMLAQYYISDKPGRFHPYLEAGIGLIYTDFNVEDQGLRFNFNPQAGIGCDFLTKKGNGYFANLRLHHLSNGNLYRDNRGNNSVLLQIGRWF